MPHDSSVYSGARAITVLHGFCLSSPIYYIHRYLVMNHLHHPFHISKGFGVTVVCPCIRFGPLWLAIGPPPQTTLPPFPCHSAMDHRVCRNICHPSYRTPPASSEWSGHHVPIEQVIFCPCTVTHVAGFSMRHPLMFYLQGCIGAISNQRTCLTVGGLKVDPAGSCVHPYRNLPYYCPDILQGGQANLFFIFRYTATQLSFRAIKR